MMRKLFLLSIIVLFPSILSAQEGVRSLNNIGLDSLKSVVESMTKYKLYYPQNVAENIVLSLTIEEDSLLKNIDEALQKNGLSLSVYNNTLYVLKGKGIKRELPSFYYSDGYRLEEEKSDEYTENLTNNIQTASTENKYYTVGDPNSKQRDGRVWISGYIRNADSGEPVIDAGVILESAKTSALSDVSGFYRISVPTGKIELKVKAYAMDDITVMLDVYSSGTLDILMKEIVYSLVGATITSENRESVRSTRLGIEKIRIDRIKQIPTVFGEADVLKVVLTLPGVKSVGESSGGINVRGGATDQNLVLFNGGTLYNPTHLFGLFSAFNPDVVNDVELYKSSIPAKYGGRISSVLDINSRNGNSKKITGSLGIGLLTGKFHIEGPIIEDKTTFILGGRTTYSNWILGLLPEESGYKNGTADFRDITLGMSHKLNDKNSLYLYGYYSSDGFQFTPDTSYRYSSSNLSLKWRSHFTENTNLNLSAGFDRYRHNVEEKGNMINAYNLAFNIDQYFLKSDFTSYLSDSHLLRYGLNLLYYDLLPGSLCPVGENSLIVAKDLQKQYGLEGALYLSDEWSINSNLSIEAGIRYSLYSALGPLTYNTYSDKDNMDESTVLGEISVSRGDFVKPYHGPEFRLSGRYSFNSDLSIKAGINTMRQNIHMLSNTTAVSPTDTWILSDANISPQKGWQAAVGLYKNFRKSAIELSLEGYYKKMNNYLDYKSGAVLNMNEHIEQDIILTEGKAYGVEFMLKKPLGKLNGWMSYTYSKTMLRESGDKEVYFVNRGEWYPAAYDKPHDIKVVANYKFTQRFSISANLDYSSGRPETIPVSKYMYGGGVRLKYSDRNSYRLPDYFRLDFAVNIEPSHNLTLLTHSVITFGVYNLTGRQNIFSIYYDTSKGAKIQGYKLSIFGAPIPYINYTIKF